MHAYYLQSKTKAIIQAEITYFNEKINTSSTGINLC
jgi:hypothetical protein